MTDPKPPTHPDLRPFPIQQGDHSRTGGRPPKSYIPWWLAQEAYAQYASRQGTDQTLERLAERGGFGREELLDLLAGGNGGGRALRAIRSQRGLR